MGSEISRTSLFAEHLPVAQLWLKQNADFIDESNIYPVLMPNDHGVEIALGIFFHENKRRLAAVRRLMAGRTATCGTAAEADGARNRYAVTESPLVFTWTEKLERIVSQDKGEVVIVEIADE